MKIKPAPRGPAVFDHFHSILLGCVVALALPGTAWAHCDRVSGPVAASAGAALDQKDFKAAAIWVGEEQTDELRERFEQALAVHQKGGEAAALAERYFMETTVRLHREAEGFPYHGLKPAQEPAVDIERAETALETGNVEPVVDMLASEMEKKVEALFRHVREAAKEKDESLEVGRQWADAYVRYIIYVHGLHQTIQAGPAHGVGEE
jgi:hypothetical protein